MKSTAFYSDSGVKSVFVLTVFLLMLICNSEVSAKRGCSSYGHSCFGGYGKRSKNEIVNAMFSPKNNNIKRALEKYNVIGNHDAVVVLGTLQHTRDRKSLKQLDSIYSFLMRKWKKKTAESLAIRSKQGRKQDSPNQSTTLRSLKLSSEESKSYL